LAVKLRRDVLYHSDYCICGLLSKPFLNSVSDAERIKKQVDTFWQIVDDLRRDLALTPD